MKALLTQLKDIEGVGNYYTQGSSPFVFPQLRVKGMTDDLAFPVPESQFKQLLACAEDAPFGKGAKTVLDKSVRRVKEIDANLVTIGSEDYHVTLKNILEQVKEGLGMKGEKVSAELYKLLVYQQGDFFVKHKDSEKAPGMFGTLVVCLPSAHEGGDLCFHLHDGAHSVGFEEASKKYQIGFSAFYADVTHEVLPLKSGRRICLVYNLMLDKKASVPNQPPAMQRIEQLAQTLTANQKKVDSWPQALLLEHQYTPENFSIDALKLHDRAKVEAFLQASAQAGYFARLALVTHYKQGELEGGDPFDSYGGYGRSSRRRSEPDPETMGEVYDESTSIDYWADDAMPTLGTDVHLEPEQIIKETELGEGAPIDQESEGFTGNAGMTIEYWYHYGAIVFWPESEHAKMLAEMQTSTALEWVDYYAKQTPKSPHLKSLLMAIAETNETGYSSDQLDFSPVLRGLMALKDNSAITPTMVELLKSRFEKIDAATWYQYLNEIDHQRNKLMIGYAVERGKLSVLERMCEVLRLSKNTENQYIEQIFNTLPKATGMTKLTAEGKPARKNTVFSDPKLTRKVHIVEMLLTLSERKEAKKKWCDDLLKALTTNGTRHYLSQVLTAVLLPILRRSKPNDLAIALQKYCYTEAKTLAENKPAAPKNWTMDVPKSSGTLPDLDKFVTFLKSPSETTFLYTKIQQDRTHMENHVQRYELDLTMETIRKGSPHTLKLTKNRATYKFMCKEWERDVVLFAQFKELK